MKTTVKFEVVRSPYRHINYLIRAADFGIDGVVGSIHEIFTVTWKDGEVVDEARKQRTKENIKKEIENFGYDCYSVTTESRQSVAPIKSGTNK